MNDLDQKKTEITNEFDRYIPLPDYSSNQDWLATYRQIADKDIQVGDLATFSVGSDSYAEVVTEVVRFKTGKRAGQIKYIKVSRQDENFLAYPVVCRSHADAPRLTNDDPYVVEGKIYFAKPVCPQCWLAAHNAIDFRPNAETYYMSVAVGYAKDYRDPHF